MVHHTQVSRKRNLDQISSWIKDLPTEKIDRIKLKRKIMLVIGSSKEKTDEYIDLILGEKTD